MLKFKARNSSGIMSVCVWRGGGGELLKWLQIKDVEKYVGVARSESPSAALGHCNNDVSSIEWGQPHHTLASEASGKSVSRKTQ
jgi:hypothetical protein